MYFTTEDLKVVQCIISEDMERNIKVINDNPSKLDKERFNEYSKVLNRLLKLRRISKNIQAHLNGRGSY